LLPKIGCGLQNTKYFQNAEILRKTLQRVPFTAKIGGYYSLIKPEKTEILFKADLSSCLSKNGSHINHSLNNKYMPSQN
jgi:hypothetical protein